MNRLQRHPSFNDLCQKATRSRLSEEILSLLLNQISKVHSIEDIAFIINRSSETIRKDFYRSTSINLSDCISLVRVELMKRMLVETEKLCKNICFEVGCREDVGAKLFKKLNGMSMNEFRMIYGKGCISEDNNRSRVLLWAALGRGSLLGLDGWGSFGEKDCKTISGRGVESSSGPIGVTNACGWWERQICQYGVRVIRLSGFAVRDWGRCCGPILEPRHQPRLSGFNPNVMIDVQGRST